MGGGGKSVFFGTTHSLLRARSPSLTHPLACWGAPAVRQALFREVSGAANE